MRYDGLFLTEDQIKINLNLQVVAKFKPEKFNIPDDFIPRNQVDKMILKILEKKGE